MSEYYPLPTPPPGRSSSDMPAAVAKMTWYKVANNGAANNGGSGSYNLPTFVRAPNGKGEWVPGALHTDIPDPWVCNRGYHLTEHPNEWTGHGGFDTLQVFVAEPSGRISSSHGKIAVGNMRLLRPVTLQEFRQFFSDAKYPFLPSAMTKLWSLVDPKLKAKFAAEAAKLEAVRKAKVIKAAEDQRKWRLAYAARLKKSRDRERVMRTRRIEREKAQAKRRDVSLMNHLAKKHGYVLRLKKKK